MNKIICVLFVFYQTFVFAEPVFPNLEIPVRSQIVYECPTKRFTGFYGAEYILQELRNNGMSLEHRNFFEHIIPHEELGFFGYHSSTQGFRIFQDIIRIVLEEICEIEIKKDFYFLRVPGKSSLHRESSAQFLNDYPCFIRDGMPDQREQLLSLNYALFGNFERFGSCSVYYFTANRSAWTVEFEEGLRQLFEFIGLPVEEVPSLFSIGAPLLATQNAVIFQLFDFSHHNALLTPYQLVDKMCYIAMPGGMPEMENIKMSELYLGDYPSPFTRQFRLVINNYESLNPHSALTIKRYERTDPQIVTEYEAKLRDAIRRLPYDKHKAEQYKELLFTLWGQTNAQ